MNLPGSRRTGRRRGDVALLTALLLMGSLASALSVERQAQVEAIVRATILYPFISLHRASAERTAVGRRAVALQTERDSLVSAMTRYRALAIQSGELREMQGLGDPFVGTVRAAEVYPGRPRVGDADAFVLSGSRLADLEFPVGVFTGSGLVGVARGPHGSGARGEFWSHTDFRVSVVTEDGAVSGIARAVRPDGGQAILLLEGAPYQGDIAPGTRIVTTGIAGVYPPGIPVGTVRALAEEEAGWMKSYFVEPAVRPAETGVVLVWDRPTLDALPEPRYVPPSDSTGAPPDSATPVPVPPPPPVDPAATGVDTSAAIAGAGGAR
ncbi:MAG: rod shape-determining protein MreC [Gemmatimonadota bacterium]|nr:rod shape-determining protein MreC [Gemmatimonadota bacterium]